MRIALGFASVLVGVQTDNGDLTACEQLPQLPRGHLKRQIADVGNMVARGLQKSS